MMIHQHLGLCYPILSKQVFIQKNCIHKIQIHKKYMYATHKTRMTLLTVGNNGDAYTQIKDEAFTS